MFEDSFLRGPGVGCGALAHSERPRPGDEAPAKLFVSFLALVLGKLLHLGLCSLSCKLEVGKEVEKMD